MDSSNERRIYDLKISQLQAAFKRNLDEPYFEEIIKSNFDINHEVFEYDSKNKYFKSVTALLLAFDYKKIKIFNLFLRYGADVLKNDNDCTVLQKAIQEGFEEKKNSLKATVLPFIQSALTVQVDSKIQVNPANKHGISHFHAACATNHIKAVEFFLSVDVSVDQAIHSDSPVLPGYTCLYLAVKYYALETVQLLLKHKANLNLKEKTGLTPLQLLVQKKLELNDFINNGKTVVNQVNEAIMKELKVSNRILCLLLDHKPEDSFYPYAVCTLMDSPLVKKLLEPIAIIDHPIDSNVPWWPGYTMLHFAAHCSVDALLFLLNRGASMEVKDARGLTPFDLCLTRYNVEIIHILIAKYPNWKNINLSDRKTKLRDVVFAMSDANEFKTLLPNIKTNINKLQVPEFSTLWPGSTLLHLAVYFTKHNRLALIEECLNKGADVTVKDKRGWTPIHLAFRQHKIRTTNLMLKHQKSEDNPTDEDNLSHLHVACAVKNEALVKKLIGSADLELAYKGKRFSNLMKQGATPIHVAVASGSCEIVEMLLRNGASLNAKDNSGLTPIHRVMVGKNVKAVGMVLLSQLNLKDCLIEAIGLNYLHVASYVGHVDAVRRLLELGADIDGRVCCIVPQTRFFKFEGFSPLHFVVENNCKEVARMLLECGADILVKKDENSTLFYDILTSCNVDFYGMFVATLKNNFVFQRRLTKDSGMTILHVACHALDLDYAKHLLDIGLNVNAQIRKRSTIWPGCTPLHVLAKRIPFYSEAENNIDRVMNLLLDVGADVTIADDNGKTPVHLFFESSGYDDPAPIFENYDRLRQLLKAQKDFKVNPTNVEGISHFHIACLINEISVVKEFLENGIDVNEPIDSCSSHILAGCTGLHLSSLSYVEILNDFQLQRDTVDVLLKYGADVRARDSCNNTPLHSAAECELIKDVELLDKLVRAGADIAAENIRKETPFECLLRSDSATLDVVDFFIKNGYRLNTFKPITEEGIVGQICCCSSGINVSEVIGRAPEVVEYDEMGRTLIHNIVSFALEEGAVSSLYSGIIEELILSGCDIDARDRFGKTALHFAVKFHNSQAVFELLDNGADINVADLDGSSAFAYSIRSCEMCVDSEHFLLLRRNIIAMFAKHIMKLQKCGLYVSPFNQSVQIEALRSMGNELRIEQTFYDELDEAKGMKIGLSSFFMHDFLSETGAVAGYPSTSQSERVEINKFFESLDDRFQEIKCLLKLQYKKALMRWQLNVDATRALRSLLQFSLPELCCWMIFRFLGNSDLSNLIESTVEVESEDTRMCVD